MKTSSKYARMRSLIILLALMLGTADAFAQANHNVTRSNKTQPAAGSGVDDDCDDVCTTLHGTLYRAGDDLLLALEHDGQPPTQVRLVRDGSSAASAGTERTVASGSLEHTDDWVAARREAAPEPSTGPASSQIPTDVHSGRSTGVRQHSPRTSITDPTPIYMTINDDAGAVENDPTPIYMTIRDLGAAAACVIQQDSPARRRTAGVRGGIDKATPKLARATVGADGRFRIVIEGAPGARANADYCVVVADGQGNTYRGKVTLLK